LALGCVCILTGCKYLPWHPPAKPPVDPATDATEPLAVPPAPAPNPAPAEASPAVPEEEPPVASTPLLPPVTGNLTIPAAPSVQPGQLAPVIPAYPIPPVGPTVLEPSLNPNATAQPPLVAGSVKRNEADLLFYQVGSSEPFTGSATLLHENGARKFDGTFEEGRREGEGMEWYDNGKLRYEGVFKNDRLYEGFAFWYYVDSGEIKMQADYVKGRLVRGTHWDRSGNLFR